MDSHSLLRGNIPDPGIKPWSPGLQTDFLPSEPPVKPSVRCMFYSYEWPIYPPPWSPSPFFSLSSSPFRKNTQTHKHTHMYYVLQYIYL